jgi:hypothetical protein
VTLHISAGIEGKTAGERLVVLGFTNLLEQSFIQFASGFDKQAAIHFINWCCCHLQYMYIYIHINHLNCSSYA